MDTLQINQCTASNTLRCLSKKDNQASSAEQELISPYNKLNSEMGKNTTNIAKYMHHKNILHKVSVNIQHTGILRYKFA